MAYYYTVRGWIEADAESYLSLKKSLQKKEQLHPNDDVYQLYMKGWVLNEHEINWTRFMFYGADVTQKGIDLLYDIINDFINQKLGISGYFQIQGEDELTCSVLKISNDELIRFQDRNP